MCIRKRRARVVRKSQRVCRGRGEGKGGAELSLARGQVRHLTTSSEIMIHYFSSLRNVVRCHFFAACL